MFSNRSFLVLGAGAAADILSLVKGGYEILEFNFAFEQGVDERGKATTRVHAGTIQLTLSQLPPQPIIEWALESRKYNDGMIVLLDAENIPTEKIIFQNTACVGMDLNYTQKGDSYATTKLTLQAETLIVGNGIDFMNEWKFD